MSVSSTSSFTAAPVEHPEEQLLLPAVLAATGSVAFIWDPLARELRLHPDATERSGACVLSEEAFADRVHPEDRLAVLRFFARLRDAVVRVGALDCRLRDTGGGWVSGRLTLSRPEAGDVPASRLVLGVITAGHGPRVSATGLRLAAPTRTAPSAWARLPQPAAALLPPPPPAAHHDPVTGLWNLDGFVAELRRQLVARTDGGDGLLVCTVDLDGFREHNARLGRVRADRLLREVGAVLQRQVGSSGGVARFTADVFGLWLRGSRTEEAALAFARRLSTRLADLDPGGPTLPVTAAFGVSRWTGSGDPPSAERLLRQSSRARDRAKLRGPGRVVVFDERVDEARRRRYHQLDELRRALHRDEFRLHYQPKVDLATGELVGVEALLRWEHPERGLLLPADFLAVLEADPLAVEVGSWAVGAALDQLATWAVAGLHTRVSVNVGGREINGPGLVDRVEAALRARPGIAPEQLELELLETAIVDDLDAAVEGVAALRARGVTVALDDFGVGASSLALLVRLGLDTVKIDRSFVRGLPDDPNLDAVVRAILTLTDHLDVEVVAEGVETLDQWTALRQLGCGTAQGYLISPPLPPDELLCWAQDWQPPTSAVDAGRDDSGIGAVDGRGVAADDWPLDAVG